jgi:formylglycine-generating enzyme required for sulfatase activity
MVVTSGLAARLLSPLGILLASGALAGCIIEPLPTTASDAGRDPMTLAADGGGDAEVPGSHDAEVDATPDATIPSGMQDASAGTRADQSSDATACVPDATQCVGNSVASCTPTGQWGLAIACDPSEPFCGPGGCTAAPPSCQLDGLGTTNCGLQGSATESCCTSLEVEGGTFDRTYGPLADGGEADPATVTGFRLDKYLVTVGRFRQYVNYLVDGGALPASGSGKHLHLNNGQGLVNSAPDGGSAYETGWDANNVNASLPVGSAGKQTWDTNLTLCFQAIDGGTIQYSTWTPSIGTNENLPINCINWFEAYAFCIWDGGFLPSEAEWQYTGAAGSQQRNFPWGSMGPGKNFEYAIYGCEYPSHSGVCTGTLNFAPVGTAALGVGFWGQVDMAGEVFEFVLDWYAPYVDPCSDCAYLSPAALRPVHGGSYGLYGPINILQPWNRTTIVPGRGHDYGMRCARTP